MRVVAQGAGWMVVGIVRLQLLQNPLCGMNQAFIEHGADFAAGIQIRKKSRSNPCQQYRNCQQGK